MTDFIGDAEKSMGKKDDKGILDTLKEKFDPKALIEGFDPKPILLKVVDMIKDEKVKGLCKTLVMAIPDKKKADDGAAAK